jgi:hypothetical protein
MHYKIRPAPPSHLGVLIVFDGILRIIARVLSLGRTFIVTSSGVFIMIFSAFASISTSGFVYTLRLHQNPNNKRTK